MSHSTSADDDLFREAFMNGAVTTAQFDHRAHVRLAYVFLVGEPVERAAERMRSALLSFIAHHGIDPSKYHETMTRAWILAVRHFMDRTPHSVSADQFIAMNPTLLDTKIMLTHYSADLLFSSAARARFVEPDLQPIPTV